MTALPRPGDGTIDSERFFELVADASEGVYAAADVRRISDAWLIGEYPGISHMFDALESLGIDTAVLSNTNDGHWARQFPQTRGGLEFPTLARVRHRFASHLLGVEKPDLRAYRHVGRAVGYAADRVLYFDDLLENVEGARAVGWTAELIDDTGDPAAQMLAHLRRYSLID